MGRAREIYEGLGLSAVCVARAAWQGSGTHSITNSPLPEGRDSAGVSKRHDSSKKNVPASKSWLIRLAEVMGPLPAPALSPPAELAARAQRWPQLEVVPNVQDVPRSFG